MSDDKMFHIFIPMYNVFTREPNWSNSENIFWIIIIYLEHFIPLQDSGSGQIWNGDIVSYDPEQLEPCSLPGEPVRQVTTVVSVINLYTQLKKYIYIYFSRANLLAVARTTNVAIRFVI